ncbi:MAG: PAS domain-containing sensor histidine kinase [Ruminococcus sp.]|nr:PAS domain-containing sensor histidine kinase [Ruminococcus sp.]
MKEFIARLRNTFLLILIMCSAFCISLLISNIFDNESLIPAIMMLAVFIISLVTKGYRYGVIASLISVLAVNYAFTFPYFRFNFTMSENLVSAIIMIIVTMITGTLATKLRNQDALKAESEMERMRANLLRAVSHDLRTPLTTIYGSSSTILDNYDVLSDEQKQKMLLGIREDSEWLMRMVENLLSVTRLDDENVKLIKSPTVLDELIDSVIVKFRKKYPDKEIKLILPEEFIIISIDAMLIQQVLFNILENAISHAKGMTQIEFKVYLRDKNAVFEISDDGCGIPKERLKTIFSGLYAGEIIPSDTKINSGIGLSVCSSIIKAHGSVISAENNEKGGATFRFALETENENNE